MKGKIFFCTYMFRFFIVFFSQWGGSLRYPLNLVPESYFSLYGEYAESISACSENTRKVFQRIRRIHEILDLNCLGWILTKTKKIKYKIIFKIGSYV